MNTHLFKYNVSFNAKKPNHIEFNCRLSTSNLDEICLSLPVWRPGRYEIANYAQYIKRFQVSTGNKGVLKYEKTGHSDWLVKCKGHNSIKFSYSFYSNRIDAGFSFADKSQIYLNPVNCFFYLKDKKCTYELNFKKQKEFQLYSTLKSMEANKAFASSYDELFDSPLIYSKNAQVQTFKVGEYKINNVFQGICEPNTAKIERDFSQFIKLQINEFGDLPVKEFTFLNQITSHRFYHGVEHKKNTVLAFGPGYLLDEKAGYENFLGLACHEFYHIWNVKHLRPSALFPYDFSKENFHFVGWIIEGVTTYQGDVKLWQSNVFNDKIYFKLLAEQINRHLNNDGRFNQSVRESSLDLWLDGYSKGIPGKKVSIYTEGSLIAFIIDILLIEKTKGVKSLDTVMRAMYENYAKKNLPYTEQDFLDEIKKQGGNFINKLYQNLINDSVSYEGELKKCLTKVGLDLIKKPISIERSYLGMHTNGVKQPLVISVKDNSPAEQSGIVEGMSITAINGLEISKNLENWLTYFYDQEINLTCVLNGMQSHHKLQFSKEIIDSKFTLERKKILNAKQKLLFHKWKKN